MKGMLIGSALMLTFVLAVAHAGSAQNTGISTDPKITAMLAMKHARAALLQSPAFSYSVTLPQEYYRSIAHLPGGRDSDNWDTKERPDCPFD